MFWNAATGVSLTVITDCCRSGTITQALEPTDAPTIERYLPDPWDPVAVESRRSLQGTTRGMLHRVPEAKCATRDIVFADMPEILITGYRADQTSADAAIGGGFPGPLTYHLVAAFTARRSPTADCTTRARAKLTQARFRHALRHGEKGHRVSPIA